MQAVTPPSFAGCPHPSRTLRAVRSRDAERRMPLEKMVGILQRHSLRIGRHNGRCFPSLPGRARCHFYPYVSWI